MKLDWQLWLKGLAAGVFFMLLAIEPGLPMKVMNISLFSVKVYQALWLVFVLIVVKDMVPLTSKSPGLGVRNTRMLPEKEIEKAKAAMQNYTKLMNRKALAVFVFWLMCLMGVGGLYLSGIAGVMFIWSIVVICIFLDRVFIIMWCPFRTYMKNKCCKACRILNWGPLMVFGFLAFIPSFYTYSLIAVSILMFIQWEYLHATHPEMFIESCNAAIRCAECGSRCEKMSRRKNN